MGFFCLTMELFIFTVNKKTRSDERVFLYASLINQT